MTLFHRQEKSNYKITLNWYGEVHVKYTTASTRMDALVNATHQLAEALGKNSGVVRSYFMDGVDKFKVELIEEEE